MDNKPLRQIVEFLLSNLFWYLLFSFMYFDLNPLNWWLIQSVWGRLIVFLIEVSIVSRINRQEKKLDEEEDEIKD